MLELYAHHLASYCWKALLALYEAGIEFRFVDVSDPAIQAELNVLWPVGKFPLLRDRARGVDVPESTIIIEHLASHAGARARALIPVDADAARPVRLWDRFFDNYVHDPMQRIVGDALRPEASRDPLGVTQARERIAQAYAYLERELGRASSTSSSASGTSSTAWIAGETFTLADCAAAPALFYADLLVPIADHPHAAAYLARLRARPSMVRVIDEARPYFQYFPVPSPRLPR